MTPARQLLRRYGRWLLAGASSVVGLLLCEGVVRQLRLAPPVQAIWLDDEGSFYRRSTNAILNYDIRPGFSRDTRNGRASSNSHGFRDRERAVAKPPGVRRIIMLGDSVVEGINYVSDENTLSRRWEALYPDGKTEVLNLGVSGYCTLAEVTLLRERGLAFDPDLVLLIFVSNDFNNFNPEHTVGGGVTDRPAWSKHLFAASDLFRYSALKFNWFDFAAETNPAARNSTAIGENNVVDGLRLLRELANQHDFRVLIVPWPLFTDTQIGYPNPGGLPPLLIERLAAMNGLPIATIANAFEPVPNPRLHFTSDGDGMHPNPTAAEAAARKLKQLVEAGTPPPPYRAGPADLQAIEIARRAAQESPRAEPIEARAYSALIREGRAAEAIDTLRELVEREPANQAAIWYLGRDLFDHGRAEEARVHLEHTLKANPSHTGARTRLAFLFNAEGRKDTAMKLLLDGLETAPREPRLHLSLASLCITNQRPDLARRHLEIARQLEPRHELLPRLLDQLKQAK